MNRAARMPQEPLLEETFESATVTEREEVKLMMVRWLEEYDKLEPLLKELCSRASEKSKATARA